VLRRTRFETPPRPSPAAMVERICGAWAGLVADLPAEARPAGVGLAAPGPADADAGVLHQAFDWGWHDVPLASLVAAAIGLPVRLDNDVNVCALAEMRFGAAAGVRDLVWIQLSTGVGGALVCGGRLYAGAAGLAGEVGHMILEEDGPSCACGRRGCLQALVSGPAIARRHAEAGGQARAGDARGVFAAAEAGEPAAGAVLDAVARDLGRALALVVNLLNPALVVLGGGVMDSLHPWLPAARAAMQARVIGEANRGVRVERSAVGYDAALLGAAVLGAE
jgi:glucokinase